MNMMTRIKGIEKETKKQWGKHKEKDTKETKIEEMQNEEKGENRRNKNNC